jgi:hypothetical protein
MAKNWWFKLEWNDWLSDEKLSLCSFEAQGFWMRCICIMHRSEQCELTGTLDQLRRLLGCLPEEITRCASELKSNGAAEVRFGNGEISIKSRRLEKELKAREANRLYQDRHRKKEQGKTDVRQQSKSKSKEIEIREEKREEKGTAKQDKPDPKIYLPSDFQITEEMRAWAALTVPRVDIDSELEEFVTFWRDIATKNHKRTMRGWKATWQKRMKEIRVTGGMNGTNRSNNGTGKPTNADRIEQTRSVIDQYPTEADLGRIS